MSRGFEAADQQADHADLHEGEVVDRELLVVRGDRPASLSVPTVRSIALPMVRQVVEVWLPAGAMGAL